MNRICFLLEWVMPICLPTGREDFGSFAEVGNLFHKHFTIQS